MSRPPPRTTVVVVGELLACRKTRISSSEAFQSKRKLSLWHTSVNASKPDDPLTWMMIWSSALPFSPIPTCIQFTHRHPIGPRSLAAAPNTRHNLIKLRRTPSLSTPTRIRTSHSKVNRRPWNCTNLLRQESEMPFLLLTRAPGYGWRARLHSRCHHRECKRQWDDDGRLSLLRFTSL